VVFIDSELGSGSKGHAARASPKELVETELIKRLEEQVVCATASNEFDRRRIVIVCLRIKLHRTKPAQ
jgi:hypothetical protein